jgi:FtsH-binding integral membrane protein
VITGVLGGLHYWLIRRDIQRDPAAGTSAIRSFFLNITEAVGIAFAVPLIGFLVFGSLSSSADANVASPLAFALPALAVTVLLELERRRTKVNSGAALAFQRLHFYGVQIILLFLLTSA